jgi:hypothetical protein
MNVQVFSYTAKSWNAHSLKRCGVAMLLVLPFDGNNEELLSQIKRLCRCFKARSSKQAATGSKGLGKSFAAYGSNAHIRILIRIMRISAKYHEIHIIEFVQITHQAFIIDSRQVDQVEITINGLKFSDFRANDGWQNKVVVTVKMQPNGSVGRSVMPQYSLPKGISFPRSGVLGDAKLA